MEFREFYLVRMHLLEAGFFTATTEPPVMGTLKEKFQQFVIP